MSNPQRTLKDIKMFRVFTTVVKNGWVVEMEYKDGKAVTMSIEYGNNSLDMLDLTLETIRRQLRG